MGLLKFGKRNSITEHWYVQFSDRKKAILVVSLGSRVVVQVGLESRIFPDLGATDALPQVRSTHRPTLRTSPPAPYLLARSGSQTTIMSFQDIETGQGYAPRGSSNLGPQTPEDSAFQTLQSSLSLQVLKINMNVQGILKLVDQLGTGKDSASLRKSL